jgi:hypothetical protein
LLLRLVPIFAGRSLRGKGIGYYLKKNLDKYRPDMVVTMMGINDNAKTIPCEEVPPKRYAYFLRSLRGGKLVSLMREGLFRREEKEDSEGNAPDSEVDRAEKAIQMFKRSLELNPDDSTPW